MNWLDHYRKTYYPLLNPDPSENAGILQTGMYKRDVGFDIAFRLLLNQRQQDFSIIETGTLRNPGQWKDGQSAWLFTEFVMYHGGTVRSVDIDSEACKNASVALPVAQFSVACADSVYWLTQQTDLEAVDLFYLDSWDVVWENDTDSAQHHLIEFLAIEPYLKSGAVVVIDDNSRWCHSYQRTGKGRAVLEYLESKNHLPIYDEYQIIWQF
jgi:predicted O-methyltransferase YrrM